MNGWGPWRDTRKDDDPFRIPPPTRWSLIWSTIRRWLWGKP